ncbi:DUF423 domain-containing protein [Aureicoccus marinus]|uniref:DUF423 domain-containing protein n=1 Tax=Aureicoccus marinus TaxID=754435 RepID=A0A2S7TAE7_9FLAO|nr:DUF423 domain-containing protein [Aureicoccus marinus]PQJ16446.1 hypothetical protein BST99_12620 [Aureicoccus marinus]
MKKTALGVIALLGAAAVVLGAFASHGLKESLEPEQLNSFQTGIRYQFYHVFFLFVVYLLPGLSEKTKSLIYHLVLVGLLLFSGSIYLLSTKAVTGIDISAVGWITPIGGLLLIIAWFVLAFRYFASKSHS